MMRAGKFTSLTVMAAMLASCSGGGGGGGGDFGGGPTPSPTPTPTSQCSLDNRLDFVLEQYRIYYLYPDLLDTTVNPANFDNLQEYIDALVAPAIAAGLDKPGFNFVTSIEEENDFIENATSADYGWRPVYVRSSQQLFFRETFENGPAFSTAQIDRGDEVLRLGRPGTTLRTPGDLFENDIDLLNALLFPASDGERVQLEFEDETDGSVQTVTVTSGEYSLDPVSQRYGAQVFGDTGYLNLRTFGSAKANDQLRAAFRTFNDANVDNMVVDLRYNGGGLVSVAEYLGDLLGDGLEGEVFSRTVFNNALSNNNETERFESVAEQLAPLRLAFVTTSRSASASELVANSMIPYFGTDTALVGSNTFGKPVGQIARDLQACDDRLRIVAFKTENADGEGDYFDGLAFPNGDYPGFPVTCAASDNFREGWNTSENSIAEALDFTRFGGATCSAISAAKQTRGANQGIVELTPDDPNYAQRAIFGML